MKYTAIFSAGAFLAFGLFVSACAPGSNGTVQGNSNGKVFLKSSVAQLENCSATKSCSLPTDSCLSVNGEAHCFAEGQVEQFLGCTQGKMILMESYPAQVSCM